MTDYRYPPGSVERYKNNKRRTAHWIEDHATDKVSFYSPNYIPSKVSNGEYMADSPSDDESTHSLPPKMVLKWSDGRPDERIGNRDGYNGHSRRKVKLSESTNRSSARKIVDTFALPPEPEQIRILPSITAPTQNPEPRRSHHHRSKSMSTPSAQPDHRDHHSRRSSSRHRADTSHQERAVGPIRDNSYVIIEPPSHPVAFTQSQPAPYHTFSGKNSHNTPRSHKQPPPVIYAPSGRRVDHPPQMVYGPNGMVYSHSATQIHPYQASYRITPSPGPESRRNHESSRHAREDRKRAHSMRTSSRKEGAKGPSPRTEGDENDGSAGSYYVLPSHGEKVHIITPGHPVETHHASSQMAPPLQNTTKRPFLQRLFNMKLRNSGDSAPGKSSKQKIERRHSIGVSQSRDGQAPSTH